MQKNVENCKVTLISRLDGSDLNINQPYTYTVFTLRRIDSIKVAVFDRCPREGVMNVFQMALYTWITTG